MKIISLNCWGGHEFGPLIEFFDAHKDSTDIFCLQEVFSTGSDHKDYKAARLNFLEELKRILPNHEVVFSPVLTGAYFEHETVDFDLRFGLAVFYRKELNVEDVLVRKILDWNIVNDNGERIVFDTVVQVVTFLINDKNLTVANFHGMPFPGSKTDTDERLLQSRTLLDVFNQVGGEFMILGDFNLLPETESVGMLEEAGLRNLIDEFSIETTRSELNGWRGKPGEQKFADYTFVSKGVKVKSFEVPDINISDHLPMIMEFEL